MTTLGEQSATTGVIKIAYPDIPAAALVRSTTNAYAAAHKVDNAAWGRRYCLPMLSASAASEAVEYDLGTTTASAEYLIIARADALKTGGCTRVQLEHSADASSWTSAHDNASFSGAALYGPQSADYITTFTATAARRYWRITYTSGGGNQTFLRKEYFGSWWNPSRAPVAFAHQMLNVDAADMRFCTGNNYHARAFTPALRIDLVWEGVSDANRDLFFSKIVFNPLMHYVFLYCAGNAEVLLSNTILHCAVVPEACSASAGAVANWNTIRAGFIQAIG